MLKIGRGENAKDWRVGVTIGVSMKDPCGNGTVLHLDYEWQLHRATCVI